MLIETKNLNLDRNVTLTSYILEVGGEFPNISKRPGILIIPGGGYRFCSEREADPVAMPYLKAGYQVFILRYSVGQYAAWPNPLEDYEQAMELIRGNSEKWHVYEDKIAVIGFSAGGHLAGAAATMSKNRPNAAILGYAVVSEDVKLCSPTAPDLIPYVDENTCPCFIFATRTDGVVPVRNSVKMIQALTEADISYESHIYAYGPHGFSTADHCVQEGNTLICNRVPHWVSDSIAWLCDMFGDFGEGKMTTPLCKAHVSADTEEILSIDCTMGKLLNNPSSKILLEKILGNMKTTEISNEQFDESIINMIHSQDGMEAIKGLTLRNVAILLEIPEELVRQIDLQLNIIKNE